MVLSECRADTKYIIKNVLCEDNELRRLLDMGFTPGCSVLVESIAPFGGTILVSLRGFKVALRESAAALIEVVEADKTSFVYQSFTNGGA